MKKALFTSFALCASISSFAQNEFKKYVPFHPFGTSANNGLRLVSQGSTYIDSVSLMPGYDTCVWSYVGNDVWDEKNNFWKYGIENGARIDVTSGFQQKRRTIHTYDLNKNLISEENQYLNPSNVWEPLKKIAHTYNSNGQTLSDIDLRYLNGWYNFKATHYTYDQAGKLTNEAYSYWEANAGWVKYYAIAYTYNLDTLKEKTLSYWQNNTLIGTEKVSITYSSNGIVETQPVTSNPPPIRRITKTYDNSKRPTEEIYESWNDSTATYDTITKNTFVYDSVNRKVIITGRFVDPFFPGPYSRFITEYKSYDLPATTHGQYFDDSLNQWLDLPQWGITNFHYGFFDLNITAQTNTLDNLSLYPVPAVNSLTVSAGFENASSFQATIRSADGRLVRAWSQPVVGNSYNESIDVSDLPAGNYVFTINSAEGISSKQFNIVR